MVQVRDHSVFLTVALRLGKAEFCLYKFVCYSQHLERFVRSTGAEFCLHLFVKVDGEPLPSSVAICKGP